MLFRSLGWVDAVAAQAQATAHPERFTLGLPNYGVATGFYTSLGQAPAACTGPTSDTTDHMTSCPFGHYAPGRSPNCASAHGTLYFDDTASLAEKVQSARAHGLGGVTYWTVGDEPPGFFDMVRGYY